MKNLLKKLCFWKKEKVLSFDIETPIPQPEPKFKLEIREEEVEEDSVDVKITIKFNVDSFGVKYQEDISHTFKAFYGFLHHYRYQAVISGENSYYDWYERNKNVNIISLDGQPYLLSTIKEIIKEEIPVKVKYTHKTEILLKVK